MMSACNTALTFYPAEPVWALWISRCGWLLVFAVFMMPLLSMSADYAGDNYGERRSLDA
jgi:hypothetical protein